jgi:hypothetical protein
MEGAGFSSGPYGGMRSLSGGPAMFDLGNGLLRAAGAASPGTLGSSLDLLSEVGNIERRGLNFSLNDVGKSLDPGSDLGLRFSFREMMGRNPSLGGTGTSFGSFNSPSGMGGGMGSQFGPGFGNSFGTGGLGGGGRHGGSAGSQVSVQLKF